MPVVPREALLPTVTLVKPFRHFEMQQPGAEILQAFGTRPRQRETHTWHEASRARY